MNYGIELEFFIVDKDDKVVPAYLVTSNLDGNAITGEIRTKVHSNIVDCVFELKKLLYLEKSSIEEKGYKLLLVSEVKVDNDFLANLRKDENYVNRKYPTVLKEKSIYLDKVGKILPIGVYKASLQINFSENKILNYTQYERIEVEDKYKYRASNAEQSYSSIFDYVSIIGKLDNIFAKNISEAKRVKGVYTIKSGTLGNRIEYRSLPNTVDLNLIIESLK